MTSILPRYDIPFVPSNTERIETMLELSHVQFGERTVDLGAGDGRVVIAMAKRGAYAVGYEIDKERAEIGQNNIILEGLSHNATIYNSNFWNVHLGDFEIITVYGITSIMSRLEKKLLAEIKPGTKIISNFFPFPLLKPVKEKRNVYLYIPYNNASQNNSLPFSSRK